ncbi:two component transcriptional regulator, LuxR family [Pedobacter suwonensis]|uniref:Two component transcriptional regulator, LuxR family n=1 Tax=Pedobacter suwonensis TaxID=332999 RepID=A0A1I0U3B5_9SPHI|nr:response regulator transcription factor [Pedobacter suwonensis]SFA58363.1 two component transcriptional regulator, LuxR family [Pedobacter suwonensis]
MSEQIKQIALVDDHVLFRKGLAALISYFQGYNILFEAANGQDFIRQLEIYGVPNIALLDINMPEMDGYSTASWLQRNHPEVNILALSTMDAETAIIKMITNGAKGYVLKDAEPEELKMAFDEVLSKGYFYNDLVTRKVMQSLSALSPGSKLSGFVKLTEREMEFLKYTCTEKTYNEIAAEMFVSPRTIDGYRNSLCEKLQLKSRTGLALYAVKHGIVKI